MFPRDIPASFEREQGLTEADWLATLPQAAGAHPLAIEGASAVITLGAGRLLLAWEVLPERRIALARLPRMRVRYRWDGVGAEERSAFMRRFDLVIQRGGG
jgi:hypothetical protein